MWKSQCNTPTQYVDQDSGRNSSSPVRATSVRDEHFLRTPLLNPWTFSGIKIKGKLWTSVDDKRGKKKKLMMVSTLLSVRHSHVPVTRDQTLPDFPTSFTPVVVSDVYPSPCRTRDQTVGESIGIVPFEDIYGCEGYTQGYPEEWWWTSE